MKCVTCGIKEAKYPDSVPRYCKDCWGGLSKDERDELVDKTGNDKDTEHETEDEETDVDTTSEEIDESD
jgi:hypothetical protein